MVAAAALLKIIPSVISVASSVLPSLKGLGGSIFSKAQTTEGSEEAAMASVNEPTQTAQMQMSDGSPAPNSVWSAAQQQQQV